MERQRICDKDLRGDKLDNNGFLRGAKLDNYGFPWGVLRAGEAPHRKPPHIEAFFSFLFPCF